MKMGELERMPLEDLQRLHEQVMAVYDMRTKRSRAEKMERTEQFITQLKMLESMEPDLDAVDVLVVGTAKEERSMSLSVREFLSYILEDGEFDTSRFEERANDDGYYFENEYSGVPENLEFQVRAYGTGCRKFMELMPQINKEWFVL